MPAIHIKITNVRGFVYTQARTSFEETLGFTAYTKMVRRLKEFERVSFSPEALAFACGDAIRRHVLTGKFTKLNVPGSATLFVIVTGEDSK